MDEMKQAGEIDEALREVAARRDNLLSKAPALSRARQAVLADFLVRQFPVEAALRETAVKRDALLNLPVPELPAFVESTLHRQLAAAEPARDRIRKWPVSTPAWLRIFRFPLGGALTVCAMITMAILCVGRWGTPSRHNAENLPHAPRADVESGVILEAQLFTRKVAVGPFNLNTNEPASLQASFFANSGAYLANASEAPLGLRLDLPVRAILTDDGFARTP
jgi:hypothetical protein